MKSLLSSSQATDKPVRPVPTQRDTASQSRVSSPVVGDPRPETPKGESDCLSELNHSVTLV